MREIAAAMITTNHFDGIASYQNDEEPQILQIDDEMSSKSEVSIDVFDLGFSKPITTMILRIVFCFSIMMNVDHGAVPSGIKEMQDDMGLETYQMGNFGSLVFFGLAVGSVCATLLVSMFTWKQLLGISFWGNCMGLFLFGISSDYLVLCFARFFSGFN